MKRKRRFVIQGVSKTGGVVYYPAAENTTIKHARRFNLLHAPAHRVFEMVEVKRGRK